MEFYMPQPLWAWAMLGAILLGIELLSGTFYILWFGIAALCVALMLAVSPSTPLAMQLLAFSVLSLTSLAVWRRKYQSQSPRSRVGQSHDDSIGKVGRITVAVSADQNGSILFTVPVMSSREWTVISDVAIEIGAQAEVISIEGNFLRVKPATQH
jgi:hypothetical protein